MTQRERIDSALIESLIDKHGLRQILAAIGNTCHLKARAARQSMTLPPELADLWDNNGYIVGKAYQDTTNPTSAD